MRLIHLPDGNILQINFTSEWIIYDLLDKNKEIIKEYWYDFYEDIEEIYNILYKTD